MIFVKDPVHLRFVRVNKAAEVLLGLDRKTLIGKSDYDFFPQQQADFFAMKDREALKSPAIVDIAEEQIDSPTGKRWLHTKKIALKNSADAPLYCLGISEDITQLKLKEEERTKIEKQLRANEHQLSLILDNIGEGVIVTNNRQEIVLVNQMAQDIFETNEDGYFADWTKLFFVYHSDGTTVFPAQQLPIVYSLSGKETDELELVIINKVSRTKKLIKVNGRFITDEKNDIIAAVATIKDITHQKEMEEKYRKLIGYGRGSKDEIQ